MNYLSAVFGVVVFIQIIPAWGQTMESSQILTANELISLLDETSSDLANSIIRSNASVDEFVRAFKLQEGCRSDFVVTFVVRDGQNAIPFGIHVDDIVDDRIKGRVFVNQKRAGYQYVGISSLPLHSVIDWRYSEVFELKGGEVYRNRLKLHGPMTQVSITGNRLFYIADVRSPYERGDKTNPFINHLRDEAVVSAARAVLNDDVALLERLAKSDDTLIWRKTYLPFRGQWKEGFGIEFGKRPLIDFMARYGDTAVYDWVAAKGVLNTQDCVQAFAFQAVSGANMNGVRWLFEHGYLVPQNVKSDDFLETIVIMDNADMLDWFLEKGFHKSANLQDLSQALIQRANSLTIIALLDKHGFANSDLKKKSEQILIQNQSADRAALLAESRGDISAAQLLRAAHQEWTEQIENNAISDLKEHFPEKAEDIDRMVNLNVGSVLPVYSIRLKE